MVKCELLEDFVCAKLGDITEKEMKERVHDFISASEKKDKEISLLFNDLLNGCFWGVLASIDGCNNEIMPDSVPVRNDARLWARNHFSEESLETILRLCVDWALRVECERSWPGTYNGHQILFRELVSKEDSMFKCAVGEGFKKRLNNGRFWEMFPDMMPGLNGGRAYGIIDEVLTEYVTDLDVSFAQYGIKLLKRKLPGNFSWDYDCFNLDYLSNTAVENYEFFIEKLYLSKLRLNLAVKDLSYLVGPFILRCISKDVDDKPLCQHIPQKFSKPVVQFYLRESMDVKKALAKELKYHSDPDSILKLLQNPNEILGLMDKSSN